MKEKSNIGAKRGHLPRLVRFIRPLVTKHLKFVGSTDVSDSIEKPLIYVEIFPCKIRNIVSKPFDYAPHFRRAINNSFGYKTFDRAILDVERIGSRIVVDIEPKNLLLVFGQSVEALNNALMSFLLPTETIDTVEEKYAQGHRQEGYRGDEKNPENRAIVLCKLLNPEDLLKLVSSKKNEPSHAPYCYQVTWSEFQELKDRLEVIGHIFSPNDQAISRHE